MAESVERLKRKRSTARGLTTRLINQASGTLQETSSDTHELEEFLAHLKEKKEILKQMDEQIQTLVPDEEIEEELTSAEHYKERVTSCIVRLERHLREGDKGNRRESSSGYSGNRTNSVKLPRLTIEKFMGDPAYWQNFWAQYSTAIHENAHLGNVDKFNYLKSFLDGAALNAISGLSLTDENYTVAVKLLTERFGRKDLVISAHMHNLMNLPPVKRSSDIKNLRQFYDQCEIQIRSLESIGIKSDTYSCLLCPVLLKNIPLDIALEFNKKREREENWDISDLLALLKLEVESRERTMEMSKNAEYGEDSREERYTYNNSSKPDSRKIGKFKNINPPSAAALSTVLEEHCMFCNRTDHVKENCKVKSPSEKREVVKRKGRCFLCLKNNHLAKICRSRTACQICRRRHNTILCDTLTDSTTSVTMENKNSEQTMVASISNQECTREMDCLYLQTAQAIIKGQNCKAKVRCLLDSGSQRTFVNQELSKQLGLNVLGTETLTVHTFGSEKPSKMVARRVLLTLENLQNSDIKIEIEALETPVISSAMVQIPSEELQNKLMKGEIELADEPLRNSKMPEPLAILIGTDYYWKVVTGKMKRLGESLVALETLFGWSLHGSKTLSMARNIATANVLKVCLENGSDEELTNMQLKRFWELDSMGIIDSPDNERDGEADVLKKFEENVEFVNGRYKIKLPWKDEKREMLSDNYHEARKRLDSLIKRFRRDPLFFAQYGEVLQNYMNEGIVVKIESKPEESSEPTYYMPHSAVIRQDRLTTKLRIVFDASSHSKGQLSLNDCLWSGPNLNPDIFELLVKFRKHRIAVTADIQQAFLQIEIAEEDRGVTKFLWVENPFQQNAQPQILQLTRVVFGVTSSPFLLAAVLKTHFQKFAERYPDTSRKLHDSFYVDDLVSGKDCEEDALKFSEESTKIMNAGGMKLRKWQTNSPELRNQWKKHGITTDDETKTFGETVTVLKVLGMGWEPNEDELYFDVSPLLTFLMKRLNTKRFILQASGRVYDPIGIISPHMILLKCLFQELWIMGIDWDTELPDELQTKWDRWCEELPNLREIKVPRYYLCESKTRDAHEMQLHVFCDASERAYGAVIYLRFIKSEGEIGTAFVCAKSRVAPLKKLTLPRLELMAAVLAVKLHSKIEKCLKVRETFFWTDSQIVYYWIRGKAMKYKTFVHNRIVEIQSKTDSSNWFHCPGKDNPADIVSRGQGITDLAKNQTWWKGPQWLNKGPEFWPGQVGIPKYDKNLLKDELRKDDENVVLSSCVTNRELLIKPELYSSWNKVLRITGWTFRFLNNTRKGEKNRENCLDTREIESAENYWLQNVQSEHFGSEFKILQQGNRVEPSSKLFELNPIIDSNGLLRVGGRLESAEFSYELKHPVILPPTDKVTELIIKDCHEKMMHGGVAVTLSELRNRFWIIRGRQTVKRVLKKCIICKRYSVKSATEITAQLPKERIMESSAFETTGIDFAGPLYSRENEGKKKSYIALFTCTVTRAVHLELISDLSADKFLLALRRFLARRGKCSKIITDNAKTFKRAERELAEIWKCITKEKVKNFIAKERITWVYITPKSPWSGGFWERLVRTVKTCLRKQLGRASLSFEELATILTEVEAILNSRPLSFSYEDACEPQPVTPAQFLTGRSSLVTPPHELPQRLESSTREELIKRKKYRELLLKRIWAQWQKLYLLELRTAHNLSSLGIGPKIKENDVVIIKDETLPRLMWKTGLVKKVFPGRDGKIRSCLLRTTNKQEIKRPVQLLYPLELD